MAACKSPILSQIASHFLRNKRISIFFFIILDSLGYILHDITIQFGVLCLTREQRGYAVTAEGKKRQTLEFNLEASSVNSNIVFIISCSAILPELVTVTFIGIRSSNFFTCGYS